MLGLTRRKRKVEWVSPEDIVLIEGLDLDAAEREHTYMRQAMRIEGWKLSIKAYCAWTGQNLKEIRQYLESIG